MKKQLLIIILFLFKILNAQNLSTQDFEKQIEMRNADLIQQNQILSSKIRTLNEIIPKIKEASSKYKKQIELESIWEIYDHNLVLKLKNDLEFAQKNPNSEFSLHLISGRISSQESMNLYDEYIKTFNLLSKENQNSEEGKQLKNALEKFNQSKIGSFAPDFSLKDINGNLFELTQFKNSNYVLIDFWASWCLPCRDDNPYLTKINENYSTKGLKIISISRDSDLTAWRNAILKDNMKWINISTLENKSDIEKEYFVYGIPHKILIDKSGIIIGKWKGSGLKNMNSIKEKLEEIFDNQ